MKKNRSNQFKTPDMKLKRSRQWQTVDSDDDENIDQKPKDALPDEEGSSSDSRRER